ncbi:806_t:CDS:1 [Ambispora leptoticha]|uniref:806_t:CDS:1 n=1 Tax=Ambispora leptoticha TaxID=144679 RepID=A0A9N9HUI3_9GLOM|nr:806_t:CDS:1 [Ambispora leptoticha]
MGNGQSNLSDKEKTAAIIGGAVVGGIIIGVTAGLATPLVAAAGKAGIDYVSNSGESSSNSPAPMQTRMNTSSGIKSPGVPTATDGFVAPRNWNGEMVKSPNGFGRGYKDVKGNVWVPSGNFGHGGANWEVQRPNGDHYHVYPGGRTRHH